VAALTDTLKNIEQNVQLLKAKLKRLERENAALKEQTRSLIDQNRVLQTDLLMNESELSHIKTHLKTQEEQDKEAQERQENLRKEIDQYIADIDECIGWLQK
jgi:chromosome segregation ATPase